jgi:hypothetical protein
VLWNIASFWDIILLLCPSGPPELAHGGGVPQRSPHPQSDRCLTTHDRPGDKLMFCIRTFAAMCILVATTFAQHPDDKLVVDCSHGDPLQRAVSYAEPNSVLIVKGPCTGPVTITTEGLT